MNFSTTELFVYPITALASGALFFSILDIFNTTSKFNMVRKNNLKELLEIALTLTMTTFSASVLALAGLFKRSLIYFCLILVFSSMLCKVVVIQTQYKLVGVNIVSELTLGWGFIASCLLAL